jgi:hypothetical protein
VWFDHLVCGGKSRRKAGFFISYIRHAATDLFGNHFASKFKNATTILLLELMHLYLSPRYGFTAITNFNHDQADILVSSINGFLSKQRSPGGPPISFSYDCLNDNNFFYFGLELGPAHRTISYTNIDLDNLISVFLDVDLHDTFLFAQMHKVIEYNTTLQSLEWAPNPRKFFVSQG